MSLELGDAARGQFFTPYSVASLMAKMSLVDARSVWERQGFITICELAAGAGAVLIACAEEIANSGLNVSAVMHATAVDVDATAVHMGYASCLCWVFQESSSTAIRSLLKSGRTG